jgi:hypothetical protein
MRLIPWFGVAITSSFFILSPGAQAQGSQFDGRWSVEVITEQGDCDRAYRYSIVIENGQARYGGQEAFNVSGEVKPSGAVAGSISRGPDRADVNGRLAADGMGTGTWVTSGSRACAGRWNAERRS